MARLFFVLVFLLATLGAPPVRVQAAGIVELDGDVHSATAAANESNINISHTTGTGSDRLMLVGVSWNSGSTARTISSVTFSYGSGPTVLNFTEKIAQKHSVAANYRYSAIWYLVAPPSGETGTVTVTFSDTVSNGIVAGVANFKGVDQTTPLGTALGASSPSNNTTPTVTLTGLNGDELVFDNVFLGGNPPASLTVGADQTQLTGWNSTISNTRGAASTEQATGSSVTMSWTAASNSMWVIAAVPINPGESGPTQELTMAVNPGGGGTTNPAVGTHTYPQNEVVGITATPNVGYVFSSWSGDVADPNSASTTVTMDTDQSVTANFVTQNYDLTMAVDPSEGGTTTPAAGGPYSYGAGSVVDITATPGCGYLFDHWSGTGIADVNAASTTVSMDAARTITAHFVEGPPIYLDGDVSSGTADGVSSIDVDHTSGTCDNRLMLVGISANSYNAAQTITSVTFTPTGETALTLDEVGSIENEAGRLAAIYSLLNPPSGMSGTVTVTFSGNINNGFTVGVANFAGVDQADPLDDFVSAVGTESAPISVDVTADTNDLVFDTVFIGAATIPTLSAGTNQDQLWSTNVDRAGGAASTEPAASTVTMSWTPTGGATAYYWAIGAVPINPAIIGPTQELTMAVNPGGGGTTNPAAGVYTYPQNEVVAITATPSVGYVFSSWSGDVADPNSASTTVTMDTDQSVTANFVAQNYDLTMAVDPSEGGTTTPAAGGPYSYGAGSVVDITATPGCGYLFDHWSGSGIADVNAASTTVTLDAAKTITAHFVEGPAIFLDGEVSSNKLATGSSIEVAHTTGACANRLMLVGVSWNSGSNARTISSIIFTPESGPPVGLTEVVGHVYSANPRNAAIWALLDPPAGQDGTITVNFSDSVSNGIVVGVANFSGVDPSTPFGPTNVADASSNAPSVVLSGLDGDELVFDTVFYGGTDPVPALTADPSQTVLWTDNTSNTRGTASIEQAAGNSVTMSWSTGTSSVWVIVAVAINPVSTDPTITISGTPLIAFSSQPGVPSASQSYTVAGSNLTEGITITPPGDFEVSLNDSDWTAFPSSLTLPETDGSVAETTIYVRFNRATSGTTTDDITHTSSGAAQMDVAVSGTATPIYHTLTVSKGGNGSGLVTSDPGGIDCGSDCTEDYVHGTAVSLTAAADTGSTFDGWSGDPDCADGSVTMDADRSCTATFTLEEYNLNIQVNGHGYVTKDPDQETYHLNEIVQLEAFADPYWTFEGWFGDVEGNQNPRSITILGNMNITASFIPPIQRFHAQLTQNNVEGFDWTKDDEVTLTIDDASNGVGVDFTDTQTVIEAEWDPNSTVVHFNDLGGIDLEAGDIITMTDGTIVKTHTVTVLSLGGVDPATDTVYGTAAPGAQLTVQGLCEGNECSLRNVTAGGDGSWSADFTLPVEDQFDIKPGTTGEVIESDDDGDHTDIDWRVNDPTLVARPQQDQIEGLDWPLGELVTLFINDVEIDTQTVGGEPWYIGGSYVLFELDGIDLVPGDVVRLTHLSATKEHTVINLVQTDYDVEANTVTGTTNSDGDIDLWVHPGVEGSFITAAPAGGSWTAVFDPFDIVAGDGGAAMQYDDESDATYIDWQIPLPSFTTYPQSDQIEGHQWHLGDSVVLNINGDDLGTETVIPNPWNPEETYVAFDLSGTHDLLPGDHVTLTSGSTVKDHIITDLAVTDIDAGANTITGTTDPDSTLDVQLWVHPGVDGSFVFATPAGGSWTADFNPYDLEAGDEGPAVQTDEDGDATWVEWRILLPNLIARPVDDQVEGNDWELGSEVTLTIDTDQYTDNATVGTAPWDPNMTYVLFDLSGIFDLQPGQVVTLSDGDTTKTHTITDLAVTVVDEALDTITGTATSPADVEVWAHEDYEASHAVDTPSGGTWSVNLAPFDLVPGHEGAAIQMDDDNDLTWVEWWVPYELTLNTSGDGSITPNPAGTEFRPNSEVQLLAEAAPGWTFTSWSGDLDGSDNPATITMDSNKSITANFVQSITTHSIPLVEGWNLVSFNVHPADTAVAAVLATVDGNYDLVFAWDATGAHSSSGNWVKYDATAPGYQNTLSDLDETMGFWIHMTAADTLEVTGSVPGTTTINLSTNAAGWNLVGYASSLNRDLPGALSDHGVGTDFSLVFAYHAGDAADPWKLFDRAVDPYANDLTELAPGWGYWIKVSAGSDWSVDY